MKPASAIVTTFPIAMDEWNFWHRDYVFGELGCIYNLADSLGVAAGLHEHFRQSEIIQMAHYAQTVNGIGAIKTSRTSAEMETTGLVLQMYRQHFGQIPLLVDDGFGPCDVSAALTTDKAFLTLGVVNPQGKELILKPDPTGANLSKKAGRWHVGAASPDLHNTPGKPRVVDIKHNTEIDVSSRLEVPPHSAAVFRIPLK